MTSSIRLALIGFGLIGRRHAGIIRRTPELELVAIVEPDTQAQQAAQRLQAPIYPDLASMLAQASPDAVVLATPTPLHLWWPSKPLERAHRQRAGFAPTAIAPAYSHRLLHLARAHERAQPG